MSPVYHQTPVTREESEMKRVPANIETAAFTAAVNATWEDFDLVAALNTALATAVKDIIDVTKSVRLFGVLEFVNSEAVAHEAKWADAATPDNDDTVQVFTTAAAAASEYINAEIICSATDGFCKIEVDDRTKLTLIFHLQSYQYIQNLVE